MRKSPPKVNGRASSTVIQNSALRRKLHRQLFAAAAAAGSQNPAAVLGRHPGAEAMHLAALAFLGLVCTEHGQHSSQIDSLQVDPAGILSLMPPLQKSDS